jgi:outer membrane protein
MDSGRGAKKKDPVSGRGARGILKAILLGGAAMAAVAAAQPAVAETIGGALVKAYLNNPDVNQQRAAVRVVDENVP